MSARIAFTAAITMTSDWGVGSGAGRQGSIDRLIERDSDGLPCIPATTLRGLWRDAAEQIAFGLDGGEGGGAGGQVEGGGIAMWTALVRQLFGSQPAIEDAGKTGVPPIPSRLTVADARMDERDRTYLAHKVSASLRDALTFVRPGVEIDPASGTARADFLRFEEVARQGIRLETTFWIDQTGDSAADRALVALAIAALCSIDRIGGKRRRGAGCCTIAAAAVDAPAGLPATLLDAIEVLEKGKPVIPALTGGGATATYRDSKQSAWRRWSVDAAFQAPVVIPDEVLGNVVTTLDYVPGTMLMPILARVLIDCGLESESVWAGFANGDIRVLPAYPKLEGSRPLPTPCVWERKKDDTGGPDGKGNLRNRLAAPEATNPDAVEAQYKPERDGFFVLKNRQDHSVAPVFADVKTVVRTHNSVDDLRQKPTTEAGGGVYSYEAVKPGQIFSAQLWIREDFEIPEATLDGAKLAEPICAGIGRAKSAGYGAVQIKLANMARPDPEDPAARPDKLIYLFAASDIVLRFDDGKPPQTMLADELKRHYAIDASIVPGLGDLRFRRHEGWINRWNLPRASFVAIKAGSALVLKPNIDLSLDQLKQLQHGGIGDRRGEGFGHMLVNHPALTMSIDNARIERTSQKDPPRPGALSGDFDEVLSLIETQAAKTAIRLAAESIAAKARTTLFGWRKGEPNMSQLGALRSVIGDLSSEEQRNAGIAYLQGRKKDSRKQGVAWLGKTLKWFEAPDRIWDVVASLDGAWRAEGDPAMNPDPRDETDELGKPASMFAFARDPKALEASPQLRRYALACLFHAAMRAHKRDSERRPAEPQQRTGAGGA